jgi:hypothetical protein
MAFYIRLRDGSNFGTALYGGKTYIFQGEKYAVMTDKANAKSYKTKAQAIRSVNMLNASCVNFDYDEIVEL